jgi:diguanylate cyclase (GGDEF)-like protein/PAS domain S-box-containing protein
MYPIFRYFLALIVVIYTLIPSTSFAHSLPIVKANVITKFNYFGKEQGLESPSVISVVEDKLGFIWLSTPSGVYRFDGQEFKSFNPQNSRLSNSFVTTMFVDKDGDLWVGTEFGLNKYNAKLERFDSFVGRGLKNEHIWSAYEDSSQRLWIGTSSGLYLFDKKSLKFEVLKFKNGDNSVFLKEVKTIFQDSNGFIWISTDRGGNFIIDPMLNQLYSLEKENPLDVIFSNKKINQILPLKNGSLLILKDRNISVYNDGKIITLYDVPPQESPKFVSAVEGTDGILWITSTDGLLRFSINYDLPVLELTREAHETHQRAHGLLKDSNNTIWFGTLQNGLGRHTYKSKFFKHISSNNNSLSDNAVWSIKEEKRNKIWIAGNSSALTRFDIVSKNVERFETGLEGIKSLAIDDSGYIYVGSSSGLYEYNLNADNFESSSKKIINFEITYIATDDKYIYASSWGKGLFRLTKGALDSELPLQMIVDDNRLPYITTLQLSNGHLYAGTVNGMYLFNLTSGMSKQVNALKNKRISYVFSDTDGVYVSTGSNGVFLFGHQLDKIIHHFNHPGIIGQAVYAALKGNDGSVWMSTDHGILKVDVDNNLTKYDVSDGLQGEDFNDNSALKSHNGTLFFGGSNGLNYIDSSKNYNSDTKKSQLVFTDFSVFNNSVAINDVKSEVIKLSESIVSASEVLLKYSDYPFEFTYNLVNSAQVNKVLYRYKMDGLDEGWLKGKKNRTATYTNLESGQYILYVEAINQDSGKVIASNSIRVIISPPLWLSTIALSLYFMIAIIVIFIIFNIIRQRERSALQVKNSAKRLELSLWGSGDLMWDWDIINNNMYHSEHWQEFDYEGLNDQQQLKIHPKDRDKVAQRLTTHLAGDSEFFEASYRIKRIGDNENWVWIVDRAKVVTRSDDDKPMRMAGTIRDITLLKNTEVRLNLQANVMSNISDAIYVMDLNFNVVEVNKAFSQITGFSFEQVQGNKRILNTYQSGISEHIQKRLKNGLNWVGEVKALKPNGDYYHVELHANPMLDNDNETSHYVVAFSDITQRKSTELELRNLSNIDPLTKLPNRSYFQYAHRNLIRRKERHALLIMDIDNFKKINDSMGHDEGDKLLCLIAQRIDGRINCQHLLCRLGGDEFALLLEDVDEISTITQVLYEIERAMEDPFDLNNEILVMSCSVGVAIYPNDGETTENMLQSADTAMYHAKSEHGFSYQFFNSSMNESAVRRLQVESLIRQALKNDWFEVYYQPKIDLKTESLMGMEALVRLAHPEHGMISPSEFIPIAEDTGLIIAIGEKVLDKACYAAQQWRKSGLFNGRVAVNLAAKQFSQEDLMQRIEHILECTQLPLANLELEITESTVIENPELAITTMQTLSNKGIHLALDDFGTGYSSLSYLKRFPIHTLKIDKAFIDDLSDEHNERDMVASIISIAHNMGLSVVAEGVEDKSQLEALKLLNCETIQGFYFSRPLSEQDFTSYLLTKNENKHYKYLN